MVGSMGGGDGNGNNGKQCRTICPAPPWARRRRVRWGAAVATASRRGGRPGFPGLSQGGRAAGGSGGRRNCSPVPSPLRCSAVPPALPPGRADGDDGDHGACAAARGNAGDGDPLGNDNAAAAAIASEADNAGQENNDCGGDDGDNDENNDKWGRGA
jgi:hypothetical protein